MIEALLRNDSPISATLLPSTQVVGPKYYPETGNNPKTKIVGGYTHGFVAAIHQASSTSSSKPDDVWLTIAQGVSHHINSTLKDFVVILLNMKENKVITIFIGEVLEYINNILEDAVKKYFSYMVKLQCGISKVDFGRVSKRLDSYPRKSCNIGPDMDFWLDRLKPVIWKLVDTSRGEIDEEFWSKVFRQSTLDRITHNSINTSEITEWKRPYRSGLDHDKDEENDEPM
ncbi:4466_t:CDS:2 [Ambispora leptoticha]|uniref:4466_t:CDS:1 n=1 Tax=Ambispora leptoticha TaxID=144679 RepID=A0A9N9B702_9GLOM|nr:4466_t:CDS:2 [Ambispora leptoticha]